jgi:hypothetical protein
VACPVDRGKSITKVGTTACSTCILVYLYKLTSKQANGCFADEVVHKHHWVLSHSAGCISSDVPHSFLSTYLVIGLMDKTSRKKKQLNGVEITLQCEETVCR